MFKRAATLSLLAIALAAPLCSYAQQKGRDPVFDIDANQLLAFKKIYSAPIQDNVDGVFSSLAEKSYADFFAKNPRFEVSKNRADADSIIETKIEKRANGYTIGIKLTLAKSGELFTEENQDLPLDSSAEAVSGATKSLLKTALRRIPFYGTVTGRDGDNVTLDLGNLHGLHGGDTVQISRLDHIRRHPLLKSILDVQLTPVGTVEVTTAEDTIAFGKVKDELSGEKVSPLHKVTAIEARTMEGPKTNYLSGLSSESAMYEEAPANAEEERPRTKRRGPTVDRDGNRPQLGYLGLGLFLGGFSSSSSQTSSGTTTTFEGSAFSPGVKLQGEVWLTRNWFAELGLMVNTMSYVQRNAALTTVSEETGVTQSSKNFDLNVGYRYLVQKSLYGPQVYGKGGYRNFSWSATGDSARLMTSKSYSGINLGVGGSVPVGAPDFGALADISFFLFPGLTEGVVKTGPEPSSAAGYEFFLGGYHFLTPTLSIRAGFVLNIYSSDFGDPSSASTTQKQVGFLPSLLYYF